MVLSGVSCHSVSSMDPLYPGAVSAIPQEMWTTPLPCPTKRVLVSGYKVPLA